MNRLLILLAGCLFCFSCASRTDGFKVKMHLGNAPDCEVFVSERVPNPTRWYVDTLELKDGELVYTGKVDYPRLVSFVLKKGEDDFMGSFSIFLDNSEVDIRGDFNDLKNLTISGSKANDEFVAIEKNGQKVMKEYGRIGYERSQAFKDNRALYDSLTVPYQQAYDKVVEYLLALPGYARSEVAPYFVSEYIHADNIPLMEKALSAFDASLADNAYLASCREKLENPALLLMISRWRISRETCINYLISGENTCCWNLVPLGVVGASWKSLFLKPCIITRRGRIS